MDSKVVNNEYTCVYNNIIILHQILTSHVLCDENRMNKISKDDQESQEDEKN